MNRSPKLVAKFYTEKFKTTDLIGFVSKNLLVYMDSLFNSFFERYQFQLSTQTVKKGTGLNNKVPLEFIPSPKLGWEQLGDLILSYLLNISRLPKFLLIDDYNNSEMLICVCKFISAVTIGYTFYHIFKSEKWNLYPKGLLLRVTSRFFFKV